MNLEFTTTRAGGQAAYVASEAAAGAADAVKSANAGANTSRASKLAVKEGVAAPEDVAAATMPDDVLSRDDALGRLVSAAFNLPPPPAPPFT